MRPPETLPHESEGGLEEAVRSLNVATNIDHFEGAKYLKLAADSGHAVGQLRQ
jgi:hypothetical protein